MDFKLREDCNLCENCSLREDCKLREDCNLCENCKLCDDCKLQADCNLLITELNLQELYNFIKLVYLFYYDSNCLLHGAPIKIIVINLQYNLHITP